MTRACDVLLLYSIFMRHENARDITSDNFIDNVDNLLHVT